MTRFFTVLYLLLLVSLTSNSQDLNSNNSLLINEIGFVKGTNQGFVELILVNGSAGAVGWSIDNLSNANFPDNGKIGFASYLPNLPSGTPILIYNNQETSPDIDPQLDHQMTLEGFYQIPFDSDYLAKLSIGGSELSAGEYHWADFMSFDNAENGIQLRDPSGVTRSNHTWGYNGVGANQVFLQTATLGGIDPNIRALVFAGDCNSGSTNGSGGDFELEARSVRTPGRYNSWENGTFIQTIQTGNLAVLQFEVQCQQLQPDIGAPYFGKIKIDFIGGVGPFTVNFTGPSGAPLGAQVQSTQAYINQAPAGDYAIQVTDSRGCIRNCSVQVATQIDEAEICEGVSIIIGRELTGEECGFRWEPELGLTSPDNSLTAASPEETTTYQLVISDGSGGIASVEEYEVKVNEVPEVNITPSPAVVCGEDIELSVEGEWATYNWSIPYPTADAVDQATVMVRVEDIEEWPEVEPVYRVVVTDENGCSAEGEVEVNSGLVFTIEGALSFCEEGSTVLSVEEPYTLIWNTGETSNSIVVSEPGLYTVSAQDGNGCSGEQMVNITIAEDLDGDGVCGDQDCDEEYALIAPGLPCNDGDSCTGQDKYNSDCECIGEPIPNCEPCLEEAPCDDNSACTYNDHFDDDCNCIGLMVPDCQVCLVGSVCDDGDVCTTNDLFGENCNCLGELIPDCVDCQPNTPCDDKNECTINDQFDENCNCSGEPLEEFAIQLEKKGECENNQYTLSLSKNFPFYEWEYEGEIIGNDAQLTTYVAGKYTVIVENEEGCQFKQSIEVHDNALSNNNLIQASEETICTDTEDIILSVDESFTNVEWTYEGELISTEVSVSISQGGIYTVMGMNAKGCEIKGQKEVSYEIGDVKINPQFPVLCNLSEGEELTLTNIPEDIESIKWSTGSGEESIVINEAGEYSVTLTNAEGCISVDKIEAIENDEDAITAQLEELGFEKIPIEILEIAGADGDGEQKLIIDPCLVEERTEASYLIEVDGIDGPIQAAAYIQTFLDPYCVDQADAAGLLTDNFCETPEIDIDFLVNYHEDYEDGAIVAFIAGGQGIGAGFIYYKNTLVSDCLEESSPNPELFRRFLNDILCMKNQSVPGLLPLTHTSKKVILSGEIKLFDNIVYTNNKFDFVFAVENYNFGELLDLTSSENCAIEQVFDGWCSQRVGGNSFGFPNTIITELEGSYFQINIPYFQSDEFLTITFEQDNYIDFHNLWDDAASIASVTLNAIESDEELEMIPLLPHCFIDHFDACELLNGELKNHGFGFRKKAIKGVEHLLSTTDQNQAASIINCLDQNNLINHYVNKTFLSRSQRVSLFGHALEAYRISQLSFQSFDNSEIHFRLTQKPTGLTINTFSPQYPGKDLTIIANVEVPDGTGATIIPSLTTNWQFDYFDRYPIRVGPAFQYLAVQPDEEDYFVNTRLPGLYIAYAVENQILKEQERTTNVTIAAIGTFLGLSEMQVALQAERVNKLRVAFAITELSLNAASIFMESETFCQYTDIEEFCKKFNSLKPQIELVLLSGYFSASLVGEFLGLKSSAQPILDNTNGAQDQLRNKLGNSKTDELINLLNKIPNLEALLADKFKDIIQYASSNGLPNPISLIANHATLKNKAHVLLTYGDEIVELGAANGYAFMDDVLQSAGLTNGLGMKLAEMKAGWVKAWEIVRGSQSSSNVPILQKISENLGHFDGTDLSDRVQELRSLFLNASNQAHFIAGFIGGPLHKIELEELNYLFYKQASSYDDGPGVLLNSVEANRLERLENMLGNYEHPNSLNTNSSQIILSTSSEPQLAPTHFWADVKVSEGKIEGLVPDKKYDYVITYPLDGSTPEFRMGLGHYRISGGSDAVKGAGSLKFNSEGKIYEINRQTGHYKSLPLSKLPQELNETVSILDANNLTTADIFVDYSL